MEHNLCHVEYQVRDLAQAQAFYQGLFGWRFSSFTPDMVTFGVGDQHIGGLMRADDPTPARSPSLWFRVKDLDAMVAKAASLGGIVVEPPHEVPSVGFAAGVTDPDGNFVGMVMFNEDA